MSKANQPRNVIPIDGADAASERKAISRKRLINRLNFIHFQDGSITANFRHPTCPQTLSVEVKPQPCTDETMKCLWASPGSSQSFLGSCEFLNLNISAGRQHISFVPELTSIDETGLEFRLPESGIAITRKDSPALYCRDIQAQMIQHGAHFSGVLRRFHARHFVVELTAEPPQTFQWIQMENPVHVIFSNDRETLYTSECRILDHRINGKQGIFTIEPTAERLRRFGNREYRSERHLLTPSPDLVFNHPFTGVLVQCMVVNVSGSGFCVEEASFESALPAGLILPSVQLNFAGMFRISCRVQVVYRISEDSQGNDTGKRVLCGLVILDIDIEDHTKLLMLLNHAENKNCYTCNEVSLDSLWDFFFETGFIYPQKYVFLSEHKERIKRTYERLYNRPSTIARHFTFQDGTRILGHIAMLRFYKSAWMIHHHAGNTKASARAGLEVLKQVGHFGYECHRMQANHMDYLLCYFRPENKFPARIFGRIANNIDNPNGCSVDCFAYYHYRREPMDQRPLPAGWEIEEAGTEDLQLLLYYYMDRSDGLMMEALNLMPGTLDLSSLSKEYRKRGFRRDRYVFSLKKNGRMQALIMANRSNVGINLSDLTSSISVILIDPGQLTAEILHRALRQVAEIYDFTEVPVLLYPSEAAEDLHLRTEKEYNLWIMKISFSDHYFRNLNRMLRFIK